MKKFLSFLPIYCFFLFLIAVALSACSTANLQEVGKATVAPAGAGITIWKIPVVGLGGWGFDGGLLGYGGQQVVVYQYNYQAKPQPTPPGTPPSPPIREENLPPSALLPPLPSYPTVYQSAWDDPTLVVFTNQSSRTVRITIDNRPEIILAGYQSTADLHLGVGEHRIRVVIEKPTATFGTLSVTRIPPPIQIRPDGRSQIIYIYDY